MTDIQNVKNVLAEHGQEHLLRFYDELDPDRQQELLDQISAIDFDRIDELTEKYVRQKPQIEIPGDITPPEVFPAGVDDEQSTAEHKTAVARGEELLAAGKVAAFCVAGGQGTRLGYDGPKGCYPATPVKNKPLFQVLAEQIIAASRRAGKSIPFYIMTSPVNDVATRAYFEQNDYFGLDASDVCFLVQGTMPAISYDGKLLLADKDRIAVSPNGHGGCLEAMRNSGALDDMSARGVEYISYFQVDNPLVHAIDPLFIGLHAGRGADMSAKALTKRDPMEKLGNFCVSGGSVMIIEYSDMPEELAHEKLPDGRLKFSAGSIAIHIFSRAFVERLTEDGRCKLPFHRADKKVPHIDEHGNPVRPSEPNAVKLEMFVFDAKPMAEETVILETLRSEEFSPIKNAEGQDSPATCRRDQINRAAAWLEAAGVRVPRKESGEVDAVIEISPLFADSADRLADKIDKNMQIKPGDEIYFS